MARIRFNGTELANPPADSYWAPGEERDIEDPENVERLLRNPDFEQVATRRAGAEEGARADQDKDQGAHKDHASASRTAHGR